MADNFQFFTPVGRFVSGDLTKKRTKDKDGRDIAPDKQRYEFGIAFDKTDPAIQQLIHQIATYAHGEYSKTAPAVANRIPTWMQTLTGFSMKIANGDEPNTQGKVNQNTVGKFVFYFSTALDPIAAIAPTNAQIPADRIKRGWFVDIAGNVSINGLTDNNAGIYMNPTVVRLVAEGDEIVGGIDPQSVFANHAAPAQLPAGARPIGSAPSLPPGSGMPGTGMPGVGMPQGQMPGFSGNPAMGAPAGMPMGAPAGMQPFAPAGAPGPTASPGNGYPAYPGVLNPQQ